MSVDHSGIPDTKTSLNPEPPQSLNSFSILNSLAWFKNQHKMYEGWNAYAEIILNFVFILVWCLYVSSDEFTMKN